MNKIKIPTFFGTIVAIDTDTRITEDLQKFGHWEFNDLLQILDYCPDTQGTIIDIGCNIGTWLIPMAQRYKSNKFLALDCQQVTIDCVNESLQINSITNVDTECCIVSDHCETIKQHFINYDWAANFGAYEVEHPYVNSDFNGRTTNQTYQALVKTIDSFNINDVVFIKIDVEGMEYKVLVGAQETIKRCKPIIVFENHKTNLDFIKKLLLDLDYYLLDNEIGQMNIAHPL